MRFNVSVLLQDFTKSFKAFKLEFSVFKPVQIAVETILEVASVAASKVADQVHWSLPVQFQVAALRLLLVQIHQADLVAADQTAAATLDKIFTDLS